MEAPERIRVSFPIPGQLFAESDDREAALMKNSLTQGRQNSLFQDPCLCRSSEEFRLGGGGCVWSKTVQSSGAVRSGAFKCFDQFLAHPRPEILHDHRSIAVSRKVQQADHVQRLGSEGGASDPAHGVQTLLVRKVATSAGDPSNEHLRSMRGRLQPRVVIRFDAQRIHSGEVVHQAVIGAPQIGRPTKGHFPAFNSEGTGATPVMGRSIAADSDAFAGFERSFVRPDQGSRHALATGFLSMRGPDVHWDPLALERGAPGGTHVVGIGMRQDDAVETLLAVAALTQSFRHRSRPEACIQKKAVHAIFMTTQHQGGVAATRGTQILKADRHECFPARIRRTPRSLLDVVAASRSGVKCGADGSFRTIEELRESIEDPAWFLFGTLADGIRR